MKRATKIRALVSTRQKLGWESMIQVKRRRIICQASFKPSNFFWYLNIPMALFVYLIIFLENRDIDTWILQGWLWPLLFILMFYIIGLFPVSITFTKVKINHKEYKIRFFNKPSWKRKNQWIDVEFHTYSEFLTVVSIIEKRKRIIDISYEGEKL